MVPEPLLVGPLSVTTWPVLVVALLLLARHDRLDLLPTILQAARIQNERQSGRKRVSVRTAKPLSDESRQAISDRAADWLAAAGVAVARRADGHAAVGLEISPLFALDPEALAGKAAQIPPVQGPTYLHE